MAHKILIFLAPPLLLSGCAGEVEMRRIAGQSSAILSSYRTQVRDFAAGQDALNAANENRLVQLNRMRDMRRAEIDTRVASWKLGDDAALRRFGVIGESSADEVLANAGPPPVAAKVPPLAYDSAQVDAIIKELVQLQKPLTIGERIDDALAYGAALRDAYRADIEKAEDEAADAAGATEASAKEEEAEQAMAPE